MVSETRQLNVQLRALGHLKRARSLLNMSLKVVNNPAIFQERIDKAVVLLQLAKETMNQFSTRVDPMKGFNKSRGPN